MASNSFRHYDQNLYSRREDAPLPPVPSTSLSPRPKAPYVDTHSAAISPVTTSSEDNFYPAYPQPSRNQRDHRGSFNYYGADRGQHQSDNRDPFSDQNAIPLQNQKTKFDSSTNPFHDNIDSERQGSQDYAGPRRRQSKGKRKDGWFRGKITWVVYILTVIQIVVFIVEIIRNAVLTHSPIEIHPQFNPMIGPSPYVLINMGARYVPCMRNTHNITDSSSTVVFPCPNATSTEASCTLSDLCGFGGVPNPRPGGSINQKPEPNQWWRFIVPIFLHAGIIHIGFNMLLQVTMGRDMEKEIGSLRFLLVYFSSGIFGFVFGGNYAAAGIASTGASGALFGILALTLLDLLYTWRTRRSPAKELLFIALDVAIAFVLGLLPGLDNFSHIGGFLMGLVLGVCILHSPNALRERIGQDEPPYTTVAAGGAVAGDEVGNTGVKAFVRQPVGFFKGRKPLWWGWWLLRAGALVGVIVVFIVLLNNFYVYRMQCGWCKYLSCLPVNNWCDIGNLKFTDQTPSANRTLARRDSFWLDSLPSPLFYTGY